MTALFELIEVRFLAIKLITEKGVTQDSFKQNLRVQEQKQNKNA